mmetsp:Transcript_116697/g.202984  ORF Transcript_116697/g.202984 Transcript_116697/m.202984 type:complete len:110 (+) Transcript_116697:285-614(+)
MPMEGAQLGGGIAPEGTQPRTKRRGQAPLGGRESPQSLALALKCRVQKAGVGNAGGEGPGIGSEAAPEGMPKPGPPASTPGPAREELPWRPADMRGPPSAAHGRGQLPG